MRIVTKIATAGVSGLSRFPAPNATIDECCNADGKLDFAKARKALDCEQITTSDRDDLAVVAFALEYLKQLEGAVRRLSANPANGARTMDVRTAPATPEDRRTERNMAKGRHAYVRLDVTNCLDGLHVKLSVQNPHNVVGGALRFARDYAVMCAQILLYLRGAVTLRKIVLIEGEGASGVFAEAAEIERCRDLRRKRTECPRRVNGYCSPCQPDCPLYENGRCKEP
ncbi:MAG: hypothetical protein J6V72_02625 [Kiritimatiellae bacterium]|nr:hypothetical protein [Kiritimatiellia bacterium]